MNKFRFNKKLWISDAAGKKHKIWFFVIPEQTLMTRTTKNIFPAAHFTCEIIVFTKLRFFMRNFRWTPFKIEIDRIEIDLGEIDLKKCSSVFTFRRFEWKMIFVNEKWNKESKATSSFRFERCLFWLLERPMDDCVRRSTHYKDYQFENVHYTARSKRKQRREWLWFRLDVCISSWSIQFDLCLWIVFTEYLHTHRRAVCNASKRTGRRTQQSAQDRLWLYQTSVDTVCYSWVLGET